MSWDNLVSAVIGSLIGSIAGFFGSRHLQKQSEENQRRGAGRAVLTEMLANATWAVRMKGQGLSDGFRDMAWRSQIHLVAELVVWPELQKIVGAYDSASSISDNLRALPFEQRLDPRWNDPALGLAKEFREALEVLYRKALSTQELSSFVSALSKLDDALKKAQEYEAQRK